MSAPRPDIGERRRAARLLRFAALAWLAVVSVRPLDAHSPSPDASEVQAVGNVPSDAPVRRDEAPGEVVRSTPTDGWELETLVLRDGKQYRGVVLRRTEKEIEFAEIAQPPGKPMYAVVRGVGADSVRSVARLAPDRRRILLDRFTRFKNRARIEAGRIDDVQLTRLDDGPEPTWRYLGEWFELTSTADESSTRRCVVLIEQVFRAYRQVLPPRVRPRDSLRIVLFGSSDRYQGYLRGEGIELENPAFYSASRNTIVAGSDLTRYGEQRRRAQRENEEAIGEYRRLHEDFRVRLAALADEMRDNGYDGKEIERECALRRAAWQRRYSRAMDEIRELERSNDATFVEVTGRMFRRLYHEAFHAYLDNYVYPDSRRRVPRWLNEGLAQIFESAQLDAETLRIDATDGSSLRRLRDDLRGSDPLTLTELLAAEQYEFLVTHAAGSSRRHYLYSWGLTYYLTFRGELLVNRTLDRYVETAGTDPDPVRRFEAFVGRPIDRFEREWREAMLSLED